ncbi:MAG: DUF1800 domain-containing protein, partial [Bacteroidetes bacterium]|nr:DUF1800 domain-containing protein [Bacteroidota bacterium]
MALTMQQKNLHLLWRAGFGPSAADAATIASTTPSQHWETLVKGSGKQPPYIDVADNELKTMLMGDNEMMYRQRQKLDANQRRQLQVRSREGIKDLNLTWMTQMISSDQQLREKMSLFWHGHFASRANNIFYQQQLLDVVRTHALGNFSDLLRAVSKSASMINFLNNNQNRKGHPNENFAREVMELFTLGRGNYTETDIKESARAFTGWGANFRGEFQFRRQQHDEDKKTFLGKTGNFDGDDILNIILEQKQTARFISQKIYRYFVNDQPDADKVDWLANRFYQNNYNIQKLLTDIFTSDWFYDPKNIGTRIKSPVELVVGIRRMLPMEIQNPESQLLIQRLLGQILFYPPNVAGWPGGRNWIDSSTLMMRMRIPQLIYAGDVFQMKPKDDDDQMMGMKDKTENDTNVNVLPRNNKKGNYSNRPGQQILATINWGAWVPAFEKVPREELVRAIAGIVLQTNSL